MNLVNLVRVSGRIGRRETWVVHLALAVGWLIVAWWSSRAGVIALAAVGWLSAATLIKRLHDRDRSGRALVVALIPFGILWVFDQCFIGEGDPEPNQYGWPNQTSVFRDDHTP